MGVTKKEIKRYLKDIDRLLLCPRKQKKSFLNSYSDNIDEYLKNNPTADFSMLERDMGTPQEIADGFLQNESTLRLKNRMAIAKWIKIALAIIILLWCILIIFAIVDVYVTDRGYFTITVSEQVEDENGNITEVIVTQYTESRITVSKSE